MYKSILYVLAATAYIIWAVRRLYVAWRKGYVVEVDDPEFGIETVKMTRADRPRTFWFGVLITLLLLVAALVFLGFVMFEILSAI